MVDGREVGVEPICQVLTEAGAALFLDFLNTWVRLTSVLNELSRSMGQPDFYPFVLPTAAVPKLQFIHELVARQRSGEAMP